MSPTSLSRTPESFFEIFSAEVRDRAAVARHRPPPETTIPDGRGARLDRPEWLGVPIRNVRIR